MPNSQPDSDLQILQATYGPSLALPNWFETALGVPRTTGSVDVEGTAIRYYQWGDASLPGVVLTHGFMAHARCWAFVAPLLADRYCLVAYDLSGMGDSGWRDAYSVDVRAREAHAVAEHAGLTANGRKPSLVCHSYGGSVGLTAAMQQADTWQQLIICDMAMLAPGEPSQFEEHRNKRAARPPQAHKTHANFEDIRPRFRLAPDQPCENAYLMDYMARFSVCHTSQGWQWKFDPKILSTFDMRDDDWWHSVAPNFVNLTLPRAIVYGQHSQMMSPKVLNYLAQSTNGSVPLVKIPDAHHHVMLDQPIALTGILDTFLQLGLQSTS